MQSMKSKGTQLKNGQCQWNKSRDTFLFFLFQFLFAAGEIRYQQLNRSIDAPKLDFLLENSPFLIIKLTFHDFCENTTAK